MIVLGYEGSPPNMTCCRRAASVDNGVDVDNEEQSGTVWICVRPARPWNELWSRLRHLDV